MVQPQTSTEPIAASTATGPPCRAVTTFCCAAIATTAITTVAASGTNTATSTSDVAMTALVISVVAAIEALRESCSPPAI